MHSDLRYLALASVESAAGTVRVQRRQEPGEYLPTVDGLDTADFVRRRTVVFTTCDAPHLARELAARSDRRVREFLGRCVVAEVPLTDDARGELLALVERFPGLEMHATQIDDRRALAMFLIKAMSGEEVRHA